MPSRARDLGIRIGTADTGRSNTITDVTGVRVGHTTIIEGDGPLRVGEGPVRTGVTVVIEATEEAVVNALLAAETMTGRDGVTAYALDPERLMTHLARAGGAQYC